MGARHDPLTGRITHQGQFSEGAFLAGTFFREDGVQFMGRFQDELGHDTEMEIVYLGGVTFHGEVVHGRPVVGFLTYPDGRVISGIVEHITSTGVATMQLEIRGETKFLAGGHTVGKSAFDAYVRELRRRRSSAS